MAGTIGKTKKKSVSLFWAKLSMFAKVGHCCPPHLKSVYDWNGHRDWEVTSHPVPKSVKKEKNA